MNLLLNGIWLKSLIYYFSIMIIVNICNCKLSIVIILNRIKLIYIAEMDCNMLTIKNRVVE